METKNIGLRNIEVADTRISSIDGEKGKLIYRGYDILDLTKKSNFEETAYLLLHDELPSRRQFDDFKRKLAAERTVPKRIQENMGNWRKDADYLLYLVEELSESKYPHEIPNTYEFAQIQVEKLARTMDKVKKGLKTMTNLGYMELADSGASGAANFVLGFSGKDVGVAFKERVDHGIYAVSVRASKDCKLHLGKIVNTLATDLGGSGGGHDKACGAVIPKSKMMTFLKELNKKLN